MKNGDETHELTYDLITRAARGEEAALEEILKIYEPYHNALVTFEVLGKDGNFHSMIDEDMKIQVQMHLVRAIREKWRKLK